MTVKIIENRKRCPQIDVEVVIPAYLSRTGHERLDRKPVDSCVADIVKALVQGGIKTNGCCCGHEALAGVIVLTDGRSLTVTYPEDWHRKKVCPFISEDF